MITLQSKDLESIIEEASRRGARIAFEEMALYQLGDAAKRLGISYPTLLRRIKEGKIRPVDGRITGAEIMRYLSKHVGD